MGGAQNAASFRRRKLRRSLGKMPLTAAQATANAQAWLATYQNVTNKVQVELRAARDANGNPLPLHRLRADRNLFIPELAVRGQQLSSGPVPGVNQFYIVESLYRETASGDVVLRLQLDNFADAAGAEIARLKLAYDAASRRRGEYRYPISPGVLVVGGCGASYPNSTAGATCSTWVPFPGVLSQVPSSITLSITGSSNASSIQAVGATKYGFSLQWTTLANGAPFNYTFVDHDTPVLVGAPGYQDATAMVSGTKGDMDVTVSPYPNPFGDQPEMLLTCTVNATDHETHEPVAGQVYIDGKPCGHTNEEISWWVRKTVETTWVLDRFGKPRKIEHVSYPQGVVRAPCYNDHDIDFGFV